MTPELTRFGVLSFKHPKGVLWVECPTCPREAGKGPEGYVVVLSRVRHAHHSPRSCYVATYKVRAALNIKMVFRALLL